MEDFETSRWREIERRNGLAGFADLWNLPHRWVQAPNTRHDGFAGVARHEFDAPEGGRCACFIKVHRNRARRSATRPWGGSPALDRELANHRRCAAAGVASPAPLYCASRWVAGELRGIFVTEELLGFRPLAQVLAQWRAEPRAAARERRPVIEAVAAQLRALHTARLVARSYHADHVFVRSPGPARDATRETPASDAHQRGAANQSDPPEIRLVDLERIKRVPLRCRARLRDLVALNRATPDVARTDRLRFLLAYLRQPRLTPGAKRLWRRVAVASAGKTQRRRRADAARVQSESNGR